MNGPNVVGVCFVMLFALLFGAIVSGAICYHNGWHRGYKRGYEDRQVLIDADMNRVVEKAPTPSSDFDLTFHVEHTTYADGIEIRFYNKMTFESYKDSVIVTPMSEWFWIPYGGVR